MLGKKCSTYVLTIIYSHDKSNVLLLYHSNFLFIANEK